jgi:diguanylate cyclase (GGDEF)-like protein
VTVSIGVSLADPADNTPTALVKRADQQLYKAKAAGRNQVACQASLVEVSENG